MRLTILGFGYCASHFALRHRALFSAVAATCRSPDGAAAIEGAGFQPILLGGDDAALSASLRACDVVLVSAGPDAAGDPFVARVEQALAASPARPRVLYLSTVGVYGDHGGAWVDEATEPRPVSERSRWRVAAESSWRDLGRRLGLRVDLFRLAGIYGPGQNAIENLRQGTARRLVKPGQVFNRIHVTDIADTLAACLSYTGAQTVWNVTDDEPAPPQDVVAYAAGLIGMPTPPDIPFETAVLSPMARSFYGENKRVSNRAIRTILGVTLNYPTYREGMQGLA